MALVLQDRVSVNSTSSGTSDLTLGAAYPGYRTFASCIPDGSIVYYAITNQAVGYADEWEVGYGKYVLGTNTLVRNNGNAAETGVYSSSNANAYVNFTAGTNGLQIFITYPSEQAVFQQPDGITEFSEGPISVVGTNATPASFSATLGQFFSNVPSFSQLFVQNQSSDANASSDIVAYNNLGDGASYFVDMGINSSNYNSVDYPIFPENSAYLFSGGNVAGTGAAADISDLYIGTSTANSNVVIFGGSVNAGAEIATFDSTTKNVSFANNISAVSNVSANNVVLTGAAYADANISSANQLVTKQYVDNATSTGIHIHTPCAAETSAALSAVYTQGGTTFNITDITGTNTVVTSTTHGLSVNDQIWLTTTAGNGLAINTPYFVFSTPTTTSLQLSTSYGGTLLTGLTNASGLSYATRANSGVGAYLEASANEVLPIAGVTVSDRVLVYNQSTGYWDGVYTVTSLGSVSSKWKLTRATDADYYSPADTDGLSEGDYFFIQSNSEAYVLTTPGPIIIGYTSITYTLFSSVPVYTGTAPINVSGQTIALTGVVNEAHGGTNASTYTTGDIIYSNATNTLAKLAIGSQYNALTVDAGGVPHWSAINLGSAAGVSGSLGATNGGTGQTTYTLGDIIYSDATNSLAKLAGQTTTTQKFLSQTGTGTASGAPVWDTIPAGSITGLGTMSTQNANAVTITGGSLDNVVIGGTTANAATFTTATATSFVGSGASLTSLNGSNVSSGTIDNARTTAATANGASTIVLRDAAGNFAANTITANLSGTASTATSATTATTATNIAGGAAGSIPYQSASGTTQLLATGSGVLVGGTTPAYSTAPTLTGTNFSSIPNSALTNSSTTINGTAIALGSSGTITAASPNALTISTGLSGTSYNGSSAVTIALANTAVTAGSYTNASITVDAQGRLTAASSGTGGGVSSITGTANQITASASTGAVTLSLPSTINVNTSGSAATATTATNQSGGTVAATTGSFSGLVTANAGITQTTVSRGSYGSLSVRNSNSGWAGIDFTEANTTLMCRVADGYSGMYFNNTSWLWAFDNTGTMQNGTIPTARLSGSIPSTSMPAGSVLQVLQAINNTTYTIGSGTTFLTGMTITITPRNSSSKFLLCWGGSVGKSGGAAYTIKFYRNGADLTTVGSGTYRGFNGGVLDAACTPSGNTQYLDSPATASAITYTVYISNDGTASIGRRVGDTFIGTSQQFQVMEIAG